MASRLFAFIALSAGLFTTTATDATAFAQPRDAPSKLGLKDVNHVVLYMQENRAFDHMLGTLAGVSGYRDPNVQVNPQDAVNGLKNVYYQSVFFVLRSSLSSHVAKYTPAQKCFSSPFKRYQLPLAIPMQLSWRYMGQCDAVYVGREQRIYSEPCCR
jgi:phospholipase C